jgi:predicted NBD/HSP70 family sugar kinase
VRRLHPATFEVARRGLSREINRRIVLNLIRAKQPLSRADLARLMGTTRGAVGLIVSDLVDEGLVFEGATGETPRGRKPKFLYIDSRRRCIAAVDARPTRTFLMLTDLLGNPVVGVSSFATPPDPQAFLDTTARRVANLLEGPGELGRCEGIGMVVSGMVDPTGRRLVYSPRLDWHDVPIGEPLSALTGLPVYVENSGRACALAQMWSAHHETAQAGDFAYVSVSDGLGVGIVVAGELLRGRHNVGGEFGHIPLDVDGPPCACGASGCFEAYVSNVATLARYFGREAVPHQPLPAELASFTVEDLIARARGGDSRAVAAVQATAHYLGLGLGALVNAYDPERIFLSGEIVGAWDLIEAAVRQAMARRVLAAVTTAVELIPLRSPDWPRLRGAAALVSAPLFGASQRAPDPRLAPLTEPSP